MASTIEYLMTYGWMLLVVSVVGLATFATVQGDRHNENNINQTELENSVETQGGFNTCNFVVG